MKSYKDIYDVSLEFLSRKATKTDAKSDVIALMEHCFKRTYSYFLTWPEKCPSNEDILIFNECLNRRYLGEPIAYIKGYKEFWSNNFKVTRNTLIPRPETELMIENILATYDKESNLSILDLGTGSGVIGITLGKELPNSNITCVDLNKDSLDVASQNALDLNVNNIKFIQSNWFEHVRGKYDIIVSNPPYISRNDEHLKQGDVIFEPLTALVSEQDGLQDIYQIIGNAHLYLKEQGLLAFEHGYNQAQKVRECLKSYRYDGILTIRDYAGCERITLGYLT